MGNKSREYAVDFTKRVDADFRPRTDALPVYHCYWCRARIVGEKAWHEHGKRCKQGQS